MGYSPRGRKESDRTEHGLLSIKKEQKHDLEAAAKRTAAPRQEELGLRAGEQPV